MIIHIARIPVGGEYIEGVEPLDALDLVRPDVVLPKEYNYRLYVCAIEHEVVVTGKIWLDVEFACCRCACRFGKRLEINDFDSQAEFGDRTESIDLTVDIRDVILLAFPNYPNCKDDCKGLCPQCGKNLNVGKCRCKPPVLTGEWDDLDRLKIKIKRS